MTPAPPRRPSPRCTRGPLISVEGVTGVGKTYLTRRVLELLDDRPLLLEEFSRRTTTPSDLGTALLRCLRAAAGDDPFLRGGAPMAEALILMAIKRHDLDSVVPVLSRGGAVIEGRGLDTTAVCQALQVHPDDLGAALGTATSLLELAAAYRPLSDLTILVTDDASQAVGRTQRRDRCVFTGEQRAFMHAACVLYEQVAATDPARYRIVDRRAVDDHEAADLIRGWIHGAGTHLACMLEPWQGERSRCLCCGRPTEPAAT